MKYFAAMNPSFTAIRLVLCLSLGLLILSGNGRADEPTTESPATVATTDAFVFPAPDFEVREQATGFMGEKAFLEFLARAEAAPKETTPRGWIATLLLVLFGGLALNFTPCVLPMIPVNLAIIGAGSNAGSRSRGFALGATYGLGMAIAYGTLGVAAVVTGARFGSLNASPVFNAIMTLLFILMALAMFDVLPIDLSRFQPTSGGRGNSRKGFPVVFVMGALSALLAGACVAPVVITVLLLASTQAAAGHWTGLLWPFLLGLGMALPWPFAGAGLARLPKPGAWMSRVKQGFGIFILLLAAYYGHLAYRAWSGGPHAGSGAAASGDADFSLDESDPAAAWDAVWTRARNENKPVFIDFHASWCKNCEAMERTTFRRSAVQNAFQKYIVVKVRSEELEGEVLNRLNVQGLPTYAIIRRK